MENIVDLSVLDYRDQLIKNYIDKHSSGSGSSNYIPVRLALTRQYEDISPSGTDEQHLYLGIPTGTDVSEMSLLYVRSNTVKQRNKRDKIGSNQNKYRGLHQVWKAPSKDRVPLIELDFKDRSTIDFTKTGYDYYEIGGVWDGDYYDMLDFINQGFADDVLGVEITEIMHHKRGGFILLNSNEEVVSGHVRFHTVYSESLDQYRIDLY